MEKTKKERVYYFDLIKIVATLTVFVCHFTRTLEANFINFDFKILPDNVFGVYLGSFGVSLFFIVSGAALMYVYDEKIDLKKYYLSRFKGIYPLFWITYLIAFFITFYNNFGLNQSIQKYKIIYSIFGYDGNMLWFGPNFYLVGEWFLSVIILLYIVFPIIRTFMKKVPIILFIGSWIVLLVLIEVWNSVMPLECFFISRLPEFIFGMIFIKMIKKPNWMLCIVGAMSLVLILIFEEKFILLSPVLRTEIVGIASFLVLSYLFSYAKGNIVKEISSFVNKYTYGFFLAHHFLQMEILRRFAGRTLVKSDILIAFVLCLGITIISTVLLNRLNSSVLKKMNFGR